ncbi:hypothetical protein ONZ43_g855 [Nemania bipapillata]|uniref:Uncharacterized protein n=1 Tax=Nemania bipapillata TaxID=110536 RepID=A0ACC2J6R5_9PEZI|nr:hypothetical protein ONZ43_g855 [Nemania bipapillata]
MEFDVGLHPEAGSNSVLARNQEDEEFLRMLARSERGQGSPLSMKVAIRELHHGKLQWRGRPFEGTLLVFQFQLCNESEGHRYRVASVTLEFDEPNGEASHDPAVFKVAPSPENDRCLNRVGLSREKLDANASLQPSWTDTGGAYKNMGNSTKFHATLSSDVHCSYNKRGEYGNVVTWTWEENTGAESGIPPVLQAAVLLRRVTTQPFSMKLRARAAVDWNSNNLRLLGVRSDVKDILRPILFIPGTDQKWMNNSDITAIRNQDLLAMEKLPIENYYDISCPTAELPHTKVNSQRSGLVGDTPLEIAIINGQEGNVKDIVLKAKDQKSQAGAIFKAIEANRLSVVQLLLDNGWQTTFRDEYGNTPLHVAVETQSDEIVELLLQRSNPDLLNERNHAGDTPLHTAVSMLDQLIVRLLLDSGADPNAPNYTTALTPVHLLCHYDNEDAHVVLKEFMPTGDGASEANGRLKVTDFDIQLPDGSTALHFAIETRNLGLMLVILAQKPRLDVEIIETRTTPLMAAIKARLDVRLIRLFLMHGTNIDPNRRDIDGRSALDMAIESTECGVVELLVDAGAEVNPKDTGKHPRPLEVAIWGGCLEIVEFLLKRGADPNIHKPNSLPPLEIALETRRRDVIKAILESPSFDIKREPVGYSLGSYLHAAICTGQADIVNMVIANGASGERSALPYGKPIHAAVSTHYKFEESRLFVESLVKQGAQLDDRDLSGRTVLSLSATEYPTSDLTYLLNLGANPNAPDQLNITPLHHIAQAGSKANLEKFIAKGGDVKARDNCGRSVLYKAAMSGDRDKFTTVLKHLPQDSRKQELAAAIYPAIASGAVDIVKMILGEIVIRTDARDRNGWTALEIAEAYSNEELISIFHGKAGNQVLPSLKKNLPSAWNPNDIGPRIELSSNCTEGYLKGMIQPLYGHGITNLRANACMCPDPGTGVFYYEVRVQGAPFFSVGFSEEHVQLSKVVGYAKRSWGYHPTDGVIAASKRTNTYGHSRKGDGIVGCGVDFRNEVVFFTYDGEYLGTNIH